MCPLRFVMGPDHQDENNWPYNNKSIFGVIQSPPRHHRSFPSLQFTMCHHFQAYLEVLPQFVHHTAVLTPDLLAPGAAVGGVVADMDARSRERGALSAGTRRTLGGAFTLGAVIGVQKIPFPHKVDTTVGLAGAFLLPRD